MGTVGPLWAEILGPLKNIFFSTDMSEGCTTCPRRDNFSTVTIVVRPGLLLKTT